MASAGHEPQYCNFRKVRTCKFRKKKEEHTIILIIIISSIIISSSSSSICIISIIIPRPARRRLLRQVASAGDEPQYWARSGELARRPAIMIIIIMISIIS